MRKVSGSPRTKGVWFIQADACPQQHLHPRRGPLCIAGPGLPRSRQPAFGKETEGFTGD